MRQAKQMRKSDVAFSKKEKIFIRPQDRQVYSAFERVRADEPREITFETDRRQRPFVTRHGSQRVIGRQQCHARPSLVKRCGEERPVRSRMVPVKHSRLGACAFRCVCIRAVYVVDGSFRYLEVRSVTHEHQPERISSIGIEVELKEIARTASGVVDGSRIVRADKPRRLET